MVGKKELEISIRPDGSVYVDVKGVKGKSCVDLIKFLEESLGQTAEKKLKPDYYEREGFVVGDVASKDKQ
ncbi:MAG TPA: DUF2997 domain-containing protein [Armatimonadota bacterium]|jgi:hypothetical protein